MPTARITADNDENIVSQEQKADGFVILYRDVSNREFQKHERMKKTLSSRLSREMVDPDVCQGFTTDEEEAAIRNINPTKAAGSDKSIQVPAPSGPGHHLPADEYPQQIVGGDQRASRMESSRHQTNTKRTERPTEDGEL